MLAWLLAVTTAGGATPPERTQTNGDAAVETTILLSRSPGGALRMRTTTTIRLRASDRAVASLLSAPPDSSGAQAALSLLLLRLGIDPPDDSAPRVPLRTSPDVTLDGDTATVTVVRRGVLHYYPSRRGSQLDVLHRWAADRVRADDIRFSLRGPSEPSVAWRLLVVSSVGELVAFRPRPERLGDGPVAWSPPAGQRAVRFDLRPDARMRDYLVSDGDPDLYWISLMLSGAVLPLATMIWLRRGRARHRSSRLAYAWRFAWIGLVAALALLASWWALPPAEVLIENPSLDLVLLLATLFTTMQVLPPVLVFALLLASPWHRRRPLVVSRPLAVGVFTALLGLVAVLLLAFEPHPRGLAFDDPLPNRLQPDPALLDTVAAVFAVGFVLAGVFGVMTALWTALPTDRMRRAVYRQRRLVIAAGLAVTAFVAYEWASLGRRTEASDGLLGFDVSSVARWVPFNVLFQLRGLLAAVGLLAVGSALHALGRGSRGPLLATRGRALAGICLVFAGAVIGTDHLYGARSGFFLPLPALVGGVALWLICSIRPSQAATRALFGAAPERGDLSAANRNALLATALHYENDRRRERRIDAAHASGELDAEETRSRLGDLYPPLPSALRPLTHAQTAKLALSVGPHRTWGENMTSAVRIGTRLMVVPTALFLYLLSTRSRPMGSTDGSPVLWVGSQVALELAIWLGAAATLGALYFHLPGWNGFLKALSLAAVYAVAMSIDTVFGEQPTGDWAFRCALLTAYLVALGLLTDRAALGARELAWQQLARLYRLRSIRVSAAYAVPLIVLALTFAQQLASGDADAGIKQLLESAPSIAQGMR